MDRADDEDFLCLLNPGFVLGRPRAAPGGPALGVEQADDREPEPESEPDA